MFCIVFLWVLGCYGCYLSKKMTVNPSNSNCNGHPLIHRIGERLKAFERPYMFVIGTTSLLILAMAGVAILIESKSGWLLPIAKSSM